MHVKGHCLSRKIVFHCTLSNNERPIEDIDETKQ